MLSQPHQTGPITRHHPCHDKKNPLGKNRLPQRNAPPKKKQTRQMVQKQHTCAQTHQALAQKPHPIQLCLMLIGIANKVLRYGQLLLCRMCKRRSSSCTLQSIFLELLDSFIIFTVLVSIVNYFGPKYNGSTQIDWSMSQKLAMQNGTAGGAVCSRFLGSTTPSA